MRNFKKGKANTLANSKAEGNDTFKVKNNKKDKMERQVSLSPGNMGVLIGVLGTCRVWGGVTKELFYRKCNTRGVHSELADQYLKEWIKIENAFPEKEQQEIIKALGQYLWEYIDIGYIHQNCNSLDDFTSFHARYLEKYVVNDDFDKTKLMEMAISMTQDLFQDKVNGKAFYGRLERIINAE